ncbi:MAG: sensor histidine kinase, partial [Betaproteobacteria bacterium]
MLHEFLTNNRQDLIERCRFKAAQRPSPRITDEALGNGLPMFLNQLIKTLAMEQGRNPKLSSTVSGVAGGGRDGRKSFSEIDQSASVHGGEL